MIEVVFCMLVSMGIVAGSHHPGAAFLIFGQILMLVFCYKGGAEGR